jgi:SAM-dependent methyltransferase
MTESTEALAVPWKRWVQRWDAQQAAYIEDRERRFDVMLSWVETLVGEEIVVLDLACGPGAVSDRVLRRFPRARSVAVDVDPVLLAVGEGAFGGLDGRLRWVRADLREAAWTDAVGTQPFDAVLSTTALHWLSPAQLADVYRRAHGLLRPGGVLVNGDYLPLPRSLTRLRAAARELDGRRQAVAVAGGADGWQDWWDGLRSEPSLQAAFAERERVFPEGERTWASPGLAFHEAALAEAGFAEVGVVWQDLEERVLIGLATEPQRST